MKLSEILNFIKYVLAHCSRLMSCYLAIRASSRSVMTEAELKKGGTKMFHKFSHFRHYIQCPCSREELYKQISLSINQDALQKVPINIKPKVAIHWRNVDKLIHDGKTVTVATVEYAIGTTPTHFVAHSFVAEPLKESDTDDA